jgi:hypothetical protein
LALLYLLGIGKRSFRCEKKYRFHVSTHTKLKYSI